MSATITNERVEIPQAAAELGLSAQGLRMHMQHGMIGRVVNSPDGKTKTYFIYRDEIDEFKRTKKWRTDYENNIMQIAKGISEIVQYLNLKDSADGSEVQE